MNTEASRWARIQSLFNSATDLPADQRGAFLDQECADDTALRAEIDALLANDSDPALTSHSGLRASVLTHAISVSVEKVQQDKRQQLIGTVLGHYRLISELGHGGSGTVYLAEHVDPHLAGHVAVKVLENTQHEDFVLRFQTEKHILAGLNHPYIARLFDAGNTDQGHPYLIMEHVAGEPLDRYCDARRLTVQQRIELFLKVCSAVHQAHQQLVVHRDLKPGNILVTKEGYPKLLDFGIAKWLDQSRLAAASQALTRSTDRVLTPEYASPEQMVGQEIGITSDIYSLGVLLYELLTGKRPFHTAGQDFLEIERMICVADPPSASQRLKALPEQEQTEAAALCQTTAIKLRASLRGDLDAILLRTLRKEPAARYLSVADLADDLHSHLNLLPVKARKGNWLYYSRRYVQKHWESISYGGAAVLTLIASVSLISFHANQLAVQTARTEKQSQHADAIADFMQDVFSATPTTPGTQVYAKDLLDQGAKVIDQNHGMDPLMRAKMLTGIGKSYQGQARPKEAIPLLKESFVLMQQQPNASSELVAKTTSNLARALGDSGQFDEASTYLAYGVQHLQARGDTSSESYARLISDQGAIASQSRNWPEALNKYQQALSLYEDLYGNQHPAVAVVKMAISNIYADLGKTADALQQIREATAIYNATLPESHPNRMSSNLSLAWLLSQSGEFEQAYQLAARQIDIQHHSANEQNLRTMYFLYILSDISLAADRVTEAETAAREALESSITYLGAHRPQTATMRAMLVDVLIHQQRYRPALQEIQPAINDLKSAGPAFEDYKIAAEFLHATLLGHTHRSEQAITLLKQGIERMRALSSSAWRIARSQNLLAALQWQRSGDPAAKKLLLESWHVLADPDNGTPALALKDARLRTQAIVGTLPAREVASSTSDN